MLDIANQSWGVWGPITRRDFIRLGALGMMGVLLPDWLRSQAFAGTAEARTKSVIQLWLGGGPSHLDTFDPKPGAGADYCGPYTKPIETNVAGIRISEALPMLAKQADKYSILRGMTHSNNGHETATYMMQTGTMPSGDLVYPAIGAVIAMKKGGQPGYNKVLPPFIMVTQSLGRFSEGGFLGTKYNAYATGGAMRDKDLQIGGAVGEAAEQRLRDRRTLLQSLDSAAQMEGQDAPREVDAFREQAYDLVLGEAKKVFDLSSEKGELRDRYGRTKFGQSCLLARRLAEAGTPFVTVNWGGWDTHKKHFERMKEMLPDLDRGFSALLEDLDQRGLLKTTMVVCGGEFGKTPKIDQAPPWDGGRGHWGNAFSWVVAGGGFKGGAVVGATDFRGENVRERPVYPWDLSASIYKLLGIDPNEKLPHPQGCVAYVTPTAGGGVASGGMLTEIMEG